MTSVIVVLICLILNALLAAMEMAFISVSKPELRQKAKRGDTSAQKLLILRENPERALSVLQIGITLVGAVSAAVGGAGAEESLAPWLQAHLSISENFSESLAILLVVVPLTYFSVVFGELVPKTIALRRASRVAVMGAPWMIWTERLLEPAVQFLESSTRFFVRLVLPRMAPAADIPLEGQLDLAGLSGPQRLYVANLVNIEKKKIRDIFLPWQEVDWLSMAASVEEVLAKILSCGHTRLPVMAEGQVVGILHSKEFLAFVPSGEKNWQTMIRPAVKVQPTDGLLNTLRLLQDQKRHMAIVVFGSEVLGVVTLEDIIEEIIGDVFDEDDDGMARRLLSFRSKSSR